jgi:flagellar biosynthesis chaperone FliJ
MPQSAPSKTSAWCNTAETVLIAGSIGSSVAAVVLQQVTFAAITSIQLSFVVGLGSWNRKRFDEINQQNQAVITQLQQQILQGRQSFEQIEQTIRQLPTYKEEDPQHRLEQLGIDYQKQIDQLHGEVRNQEGQLKQFIKNLTSLQQSLQSASSIDIDHFQDRIHDLKVYFESKVRTLDEDNQSLVDQVNNRLVQIEETIS